MRIFVIAFTVLAVRAAMAGPPEDERLYNEGVKLYEQKHYREAAERFEAAFGADPKPAYLFNGGDAYELAGDLAGAWRLFTQYATASTRADRLAQVRARIAVLEAALQKTRVHLHVEVEPPGAALLLDADRAPLDPPLDVWLPAGPHGVTAVKDGFEPQAVRMTLVLGAQKSLRLTLAPAVPLGRLDVRSVPSGARVLLDGKPIGLTPWIADRVPVGPHRVRVEAPGHAAREEGVEVREGAEAKVALTLVPSSTPLPAPVAQVEGGWLVRQWWLWTVVGAAVAGGVVAVVLATQTPDPVPAPPAAHAWEPSFGGGTP